ncbi:MAG: hypothetical protein K1X74_00930 [Pirellulales bacterium]|nr:hypothetical protein [Pirellulales bacterium]
MRAGGVGAIYLVHGTFVGTDAFGLLATLALAAPPLAAQLQPLGKRWFDDLLDEAGNYTPNFADRLADAFHTDDGADVPVRMFHWSSANNHLGRAHAAVQLLDTLLAAPLPSGRRVMLWGHSHAGNVFALLTHLLGSDAATRERFFAAVRPHLEELYLPADVAAWQRVEQCLAAGATPLAHTPLDLVTFGTPRRYGWETRGYARLLHFSNHRPQPNRRADQAPYPISPDALLAGRGGDYIEQLGIAGTDLPPGPFSYVKAAACRALAELIEPEVGVLDLLGRVARTTRVHDDGLNLLVDYGDPAGTIADHFAGHAIYTRSEALTFHLEQLAEHWFPPSD